MIRQHTPCCLKGRTCDYCVVLPFRLWGHGESRFYRRLRFATLRLWKSGFSSRKKPTTEDYFVINFDAVALVSLIVLELFCYFSYICGHFENQEEQIGLQFNTNIIN
jgi:hypothetical protein